MECLGWYGGEGFYPEDGVVFVRLRVDSVLELLVIARVRQVEMGPRHKHWRAGLTLSNVLKR